MKKSKNQRKRAYKQRSARHKAYKNTSRRNLSVMPFMGGQLIRISGLTREEAERMSADASKKFDVMSWVSTETLLPTMVLWKSDFTDNDPFFRLTFDPRETKANMVHNILGADFHDIDEAPNAIGEITTSDGIVFCVGTWEAFLLDANEEQVKSVIEFLDEFNLAIR